MILNIRGSSCSGKSHIVRQLLAEFPSSEVWEKTGWNKTRPKHVGHLLPGGLFIAGPYSKEKNVGLADLQPDRMELSTLWLERNCLRYPFVIFESTAASLSIGRYHDLRERLDVQLEVEKSITFAYLDTPLGVCRDRLKERGGDPATANAQWARVQQIRSRLEDLHENCITLDYLDAYAQLITLLQVIGGWDPFSTPPITHPKVKTRYSLQDVWTELLSTYMNGDGEYMRRFQNEMDKHAEKFVS